jgi:hypothetical protein
MGPCKLRLLVLALAAIVVAPSLRLAAAQDGGAVVNDAPSPPFDPNDPDAAYLFGFPFCKCKDYRCSTSPYRVVTASKESLSNGNLRVCFSFNDVGCAANNTCCQSILQLFNKIEMQAGETGML